MYLRCLGILLLLLSMLRVAAAVMVPTHYVGINSTTSLSLSSLLKPKIAIDFSNSVSSVGYTFSGGTTDTINYIQLCNATDNTCSSCGAPFTIITTGTPIPYSTSGTSYNIKSSAIAAYLSANGLGAGSYNVGMYVQSTHFHCSADTAYCGDQQDSSDHALCMQATYDGETVTSLARSDNGSAALTTPTSQFAYVAGYVGHNMYYCTLNSDGSFNDCEVTSPAGLVGDAWSPMAETFAKINSTQYAYVADANSHLYQCTLSTLTRGALDTCHTTPLDSPTWNPQRVTFATVNGTQYGYVVDVTSHKVNQCSLNSDGSLDECAPIVPVSGVSFGSPRGITFANVGGTQYAYIAGYVGHNMYYCTLNSNGSFNDCEVTSPTGLSGDTWSPMAEAFATVNGTQYAYVADADGHVYYCTLNNADGSLTACNLALSSEPSWTPYGIAVATVHDIQYAYVAGNGGNLYECQFNTSGGGFSACSPTAGGISAWSPNDVAFATAGNGTQYAYIVSASPNHVYQCSLNADDGTFNTCAITPTTGEPAWVIRGIGIANIQGTPHAYVASTSGDDGQHVYHCALNNDGTFNACTVTPSSPPAWTPYGVTVATVNGTQYAYIADSTGKAYRCQFRSSGNLSLCTITAGGISSWSPNDLAFATAGNGTQYAYIVSASPNHVYQCSLNTNGTFNTCAVTPTSGEPAWVIRGLAVANVKGTLQAYVASTSGSDGQHVYHCAVNANGTFNACTATPASGEPGWNPQRVAIATINGVQYAYVADVTGHKAYQCTLNDDGTFNTCAVTPSSDAPSWNIRGLALPYIF